MQIFKGILLILLGGIALTACGNSHNSKETPDGAAERDSVPSTVKGVVDAVAADDSVSFAKLVSYPLHRPYPLRDISTPEEMTSYYKTLVDDSLRNVISHSTSKEWNEEGWRGWTLDNGQYIWVDESVYAVDYVSAAERREHKRLAESEMSSLHKNLRKGWRPRLCLIDSTTGRIYRVDRAEESKAKDREYRLAIYANNHKLHDTPEASYSGALSEEGTAESPVYVFVAPGGRHIILDEMPADSPYPRIFDGDDDPGHELRRAYWRDLLPADEHPATDSIK